MKVKLVIVFCLLMQGTSEILSQESNKPLKEIRTLEKVIAITLDDGPIVGITEGFLVLFDELNVRATFFNVGRKMMELPDLSKAVLEKGHEIGNHSMNHKRLPDLNDYESKEKEIVNFQTNAQKIFCYKPVLFRAPFLKHDDEIFKILNENKLISINASIYAKDAGKDVDPELIYKKIIASIKPGAIILCHERMHTLQALKEVIPELQKEGYTFVTVSELLNENQ